MKKEPLFIVAIALALLLLTNSYLGVSLGDRIFKLFGLSPWTKGDNNGFHLSVLLGLILLVVGIRGTVKFYRSRYPKVLSRTILACIAFVFLYPAHTEKAMFILYHDSHGLNSIDYSKKNSNCSIQSEGNNTTAKCSLTFYNYGKEESLMVRPVLYGNFTNIEFESKQINIRPHSKVTIGTEFNGLQNDGAGFMGTFPAIGVEMMIDGKKKIVKGVV
ncbi:hypothetical protein D7Z26_00350 [Cohnella endophytica]|uniref:Uncharacterized protein n=1 Tax=Cohnella endophytica TaxID=2419778 RepID=A0A494Y8S3_9BACL|nr:hypothetical protein [Cohnella endophytica]RKP57998.1 hypothetical protein D7Z26_00350 [Cohnella endophytica]